MTQLANGLGTLIDVRKLENGGNTMHITLSLKCKDGSEVVTERYFNKTNYTPEELLEQGDITTNKRLEQIVQSHAHCFLGFLTVLEMKTWTWNDFAFCVFYNLQLIMGLRIGKS